MRRKKHLDERISKLEHLLVHDLAKKRGTWLTPESNSLHIELGCGKARFTVETAANNPKILFIAFEKSENVLVTALERAEAKCLKNIRFAKTVISDLRTIFSCGEVNRIYINFCDPWPAKKHEKRRLTSPGFLNQYTHILAPNGDICFRTDNDPLFEYSLNQLEAVGFSLSDITRNLHEIDPAVVMTDYEQKFCSQGVLINSCRATLKIS